MLTTPGIFIPAVPTGESVFGASSCPVIALRHYTIRNTMYITQHPELKKGRLIVPIKDNNAGNELRAATLSRWSALL